jgi:hypothetical protein
MRINKTQRAIDTNKENWESLMALATEEADLVSISTHRNGTMTTRHYNINYNLMASVFEWNDGSPTDYRFYVQAPNNYNMA